ncbi:MAG: M20/M25/M40 family metallo-hydrolase, partial [Sphingomonas sp.]
MTPVAADGWRDRADQLLADIVAIPSVDGKLGARPVAERLAREFQRAGFTPADVRILRYRKTAALMVRLRARQPRRGTILLLGHMDVVEADRADWSRDPFTLTRDGEYLYGRGTADMKGGLVAQAIALMRMHDDHMPIDRDIVLFATGDEETE